MTGDAARLVEALMLVRGGVALADSADASRCYPNLWGTPAAARQAFYRQRRVTDPGGEAPEGQCHAPLRRATYQRAGAGKRPASLTFDPGVVNDLRGWLEERIGPLARLEMEPSRDPPPPEPPGRPQAPAEGPPAVMPTANGSAGAHAAAGSDPGPLGGAVHHPEAVPAAPAPSTALREALAVRLLAPRLYALAGRLEAFQPRRTWGVPEIDRQAWLAAAREAAGLPSAEWAAWRGTVGTEGATRPPAASATGWPAGEAHR